MLASSLLSLLSVAGLASAHFHLEYPYWRGDSFAEGNSQWDFPCANVNETTDLANRTQWTSSGGSIRIKGSHPWALTYVNIGLGTNVSSFNISLLNHFNQTGNGTFCLKSVGGDALTEGLKSAGLDAKSADGTQASIQVIQISSTGASLFNCADVTLNSSAPLLADSDCTNATNVGGVQIENVGSATTSGSPNASGSGASAKSTGGAGTLRASVGSMGAVALVGAVVGLL